MFVSFFSIVCQNLFFFIVCWSLAGLRPAISKDSEDGVVHVYHFTHKHWSALIKGKYNCDNIICMWHSDDDITKLYDDMMETTIHLPINPSKPHISLSLYNVHSWKNFTNTTTPDLCIFNTTLTMFESTESHARFEDSLFKPAYPYFDGFSTTHPKADVQRIYEAAWSSLRRIKNKSLPTFSSLIKGAAYVARDCHQGRPPSNRDHIVQLLRSNGLRVDGLSRCMNTPKEKIEEGVDISVVGKMSAISRYAFYLAFENSVEPGYVTEKAFHGILAGIVPLYLGDADRLKALIPDPKAVIFLSDFDHNITAVTQHLLALLQNESAYEQLRSWRSKFSYEEHVRQRPLLTQPWWCAVCQWAHNEGMSMGMGVGVGANRSVQQPRSRHRDNIPRRDCANTTTMTTGV